jgi:hypothetical protein
LGVQAQFKEARSNGDVQKYKFKFKDQLNIFLIFGLSFNLKYIIANTPNPAKT